MRPVETIPGMGGGEINERGRGRMMEGVNAVPIYCKNFGKCHIVSPV
jgi:hypothetical protein